jgi:PAS domain S-box-containing protein
VSEQRLDQLGPDRFAHSTLLDALPDGVILVDHDGRIVEFNARAQEMFGYDRDEVVGEPVELLMPDRFRREHAEHRDRYGRSPHVRPMGAELELVGRRKNGQEFPVEISLAPYQSPQGPLVVSAIRDVSGRRGVADQQAGGPTEAAGGGAA